MHRIELIQKCSVLKNSWRKGRRLATEILPSVSWSCLKTLGIVVNFHLCRRIKLDDLHEVIEYRSSFSSWLDSFGASLQAATFVRRPWHDAKNRLSRPPKIFCIVLETLRPSKTCSSTIFQTKNCNFKPRSKPSKLHVQRPRLN